MEWRKERICNDGIMAWWNDWMMKLWNGGMEEWLNDGMEGWKDHLVWPKGNILKVSCWYLYKKCFRKGGQEEGYLEDIEGSSQETWKTAVCWIQIHGSGPFLLDPDPFLDPDPGNIWYVHWIPDKILSVLLFLSLKFRQAVQKLWFAVVTLIFRDGISQKNFTF